MFFMEQVCHEDIGGRERKAPFILNLDSDGVSAINFKLRPIHPLPKIIYYPTKQKDGWSSEIFWKFLGRKYLPTVTTGHAIQCGISARI